jgi:Zn-dependent protease with chaperone function
VPAPGRYSDGKTAGSLPVELSLSGSHLSIRGVHAELATVDLRSAKFIAPVGNGPWTIELPDHASVFFDDEAFGETLLAAGGRRDRLRWLESRWHLALLALAISIAGTWVLLEFGVPAAARQVAAAVPPTLEASLRRESIDVVDGWLFAASELPPERQAHIDALFAGVLATDPALSEFELEFRSSQIGANAFAFPGGVVVITDELVALAESDDELVAVLAHEVGHLAHDHSLRILLQNSASALIIAGLTGDLTNISALSATIPTVLMQAKYSRAFEREADDFAFDYLGNSGRDAGALRKLLQRMESAHGEDGSIPSWISSHPRTAERAPE